MDIRSHRLQQESKENGRQMHENKCTEKILVMKALIDQIGARSSTTSTTSRRGTSSSKENNSEGAARVAVREDGDTSPPPTPDIPPSPSASTQTMSPLTRRVNNQLNNELSYPFLLGPSPSVETSLAAPSGADSRRAGESERVNGYKVRRSKRGRTGVEEEERLRQENIRRLQRVLCLIGWIVCCPCWTIGFSLREQPGEFEEEDKELDEDFVLYDPCWP